ncbi:MAG: class I SAM-dependent methyltransferase [Haloarculaceae archaeon]
MEETRDLWNAWSDAFQSAWNADTTDEPPPADVHYGPGWPADERLDHLPDIGDADVVELGCGGGPASVGFARRGAASVAGVDLSTRQLEHARRLAGLCGVDVEFLAGDVTELPFAADAFDLAFSSWVLQMVDDLDACFAEAARVLREGGTLFFAMPHPFYGIFDPETGEIERSYFDSTPERKSIGDLDPEMTVFHHRVADIHRALVDAGFTVEQLFEPGSGDPEDYEEQWSHEPELMATVPPTLAVRAVV